MIYFDNSATSYPKPLTVISSINTALKKYGGNPGRSGHKLSFLAAKKVFESREKIGTLFSCETENVVFTSNCTHALNIAIKGLYKKNSKIITTELDHNSVLRPLYTLSKNKNVDLKIIKCCNLTDDEIVSNFKEKLDDNVSLIVTTHASNITGQILPIRRIFKLAQEKNIPFILDAAQSGGKLDIKVGIDANIVCLAGHKGLYGPTGTGLLLLDGKFMPKTLMEGGTGNKSLSLEQPNLPPEQYEAGTINTVGIIGLSAGIDFINKRGMKNILNHEKILCDKVYKSFKNNQNIKVFSNPQNQVPIILFNFKNISPSLAVQILSEKGFALRGGLHCSPLAHKALNTLPQGAIRFSPSVFNTNNETAAFIDTVHRMSTKKYI